MQLRKLENDIYALPDTLQPPAEPSLLIIVNEADVVVVAPGAQPAAAEIIGLVRSITDKPASVLVHTQRCAAPADCRSYGEAFPGLRLIEPVERGARPDPPVVGDLVLQRGARRIHIRHLGGEVVVWLPQERILAGGTLGLLRAA